MALTSVQTRMKTAGQLRVLFLLRCVHDFHLGKDGCPAGVSGVVWDPRAHLREGKQNILEPLLLDTSGYLTWWRKPNSVQRFRFRCNMEATLLYYRSDKNFKQMLI